MSDADNQSQQDLSLPQPAPQGNSQAGDSSAPAAPVQQPPTPVNNATASQSPSTAEDSDLIEKEWVEKAKDIVEKTRDDPYQQNKALSQMKADYIKKRYNKDLRLDSE